MTSFGCVAVTVATMRRGYVIFTGPNQGLGEDRCTLDGYLSQLPLEQTASHPDVCECCIEAFYESCPVCGMWVRDLARHEYEAAAIGPTCAGLDLESYNEAIARRTR